MRDFRRISFAKNDFEWHQHIRKLTMNMLYNMGQRLRMPATGYHYMWSGEQRYDFIRAVSITLLGHE